jgi:hypothetical protein
MRRAQPRLRQFATMVAVALFVGTAAFAGLPGPTPLSWSLARPSSRDQSIACRVVGAGTERPDQRPARPDVSELSRCAR